jgi:hypothetical protein
MWTSGSQCQAERLIEELQRTDAGAVVLSNPLLDDASGLIDNEHSWVCHTELAFPRLQPELSMVCGKIAIEKAKIGDDPTAHI